MRECQKPKKKKDLDTDLSKQNESTTSSVKPKNKPVGLVNAIVEHNFKGDGFWMAEEVEVAPTLTTGADLDPCLGDPDDLEGDASNELTFDWDGPYD